MSSRHDMFALRDTLEAESAAIESIVRADEHAGIAWWNGLTRRERAAWLELVDEGGDASVAKAWAEYKRRRDAGELERASS